MKAEQERLRSGKAVAAALMLAGLLLAAAAIFLFVVVDRACAGRRPASSASVGALSPGEASI
ncbi:MAG TPA: hypothetical protein VGL03_16670 [Thermoanaerobaculia bacterium]|jgi:hypothetical protein